AWRSSLSMDLRAKSWLGSAGSPYRAGAEHYQTAYGSGAGEGNKGSSFRSGTGSCSLSRQFWMTTCCDGYECDFSGKPAMAEELAYRRSPVFESNCGSFPALHSVLDDKVLARPPRFLLDPLSTCDCKYLIAKGLRLRSCCKRLKAKNLFAHVR
ncbi:MAG: hypothetical protein ACLGSH_03575, partial [Acidobacteriota bacterium]